MKEKNILFGLGLIFVIISSYKLSFLKKLSLDIIPESNKILDEVEYSWVGKSIFQTGIPAAWSDIPVYRKNNQFGKIDGFSIRQELNIKPAIKNYLGYLKPLVSYENYNGSYLLFVQPFLDSPPLAGIIYGLGVDNQKKTFNDLKAEDFRRMTPYLSIISGILIYILAYQLFGLSIGILSFLIYSTVPSYFFSSRLALAENVLIPFYLLSLNLLVLGKDKTTKIYLILAGIFGGLSALVKISGWSILVMETIILIYWKRRNDIKYLLTAGIFFGLLYFVYGIYLDSDTFINVLLSQGSRISIGINSFLKEITGINLFNFPIDGWWVGGIFVSLLLLKDNKYTEIKICFFTYLLIILLLGGGNYSWYLFPLIPFMSIGLALFIKDLFNNNSFEYNFIYFGFLFLSSYFWGYSVRHPGSGLQILFRILVIMLLIVFPLLRNKYYRNYRFQLIKNILLGITVFCCFYWNIKSIYYLMLNWGMLQPPLVYR